jgi:DNA-binding NtrC family response regulator/tetratricopeptide (TPR) repeat protein
VLSAALQRVMTRAQAALERGRGAEAIQLLQQALRSTSLTRDDELAMRVVLAEAWLLQDDLTQASASLGRPPDAIRESVAPVTLSHLWRLHGRLASARGDQSRAIALHGRALKQGEAAHDLRATGLAHFELARCYKNVGDRAIMAEHFGEAASALHAVGDKRTLALVHSLNGSALAQQGRYDEALTALRQAERVASSVGADDVVAIVCGNQANVAMIRHRYEQALALAERSVALHEQYPPGHSLAVSLATLGQVCIRLGALSRAHAVLHRALDVRRGMLFHETTGAIFDSLAQIHLVRGDYDQAEESLGKAREAYGAYDAHTPRWYDWSLRLIEARLAERRGQFARAVELADDIAATAGVPPADELFARLIGIQALAGGGRLEEAAERIEQTSAKVDPRTTPGAWGEFLRARGVVASQTGRAPEGYHDLAQSANVFDLLGERYQAALSQLALGTLAGRAGARSLAARTLDQAGATFAELGAARDARDVEAARDLATQPGTGEFIGTPADADDAVVRRLVDAAALPDLLAREAAAAFLEVTGADAVAIFVRAADEPRIIGRAGTDHATAAALVRAAVNGSAVGGTRLVTEPLGADKDGPRVALIALSRPLGNLVERRLRMVGAVARQGFELAEARERPARVADPAAIERPLEPLIPGFLSAGATMSRLVDQIKRLRGNQLTVLISGESGTGKELVARAIHSGSLRANAQYLPYNCTTTTRDLADSQLFGHRRGSFTGAVTDQPGLIRSAAGGTLFLDEIGDLPLDVQPKLLRFLEQGEIMPVGETRPLNVDVRVLAATNADLEQRVTEGRFREDLYYRLSVIRIHVPPLRERRDEIPHLTSYFLREAIDELNKPDVELSPAVLDLFAQYMWPGNVRQLRNELKRAVALSQPGSAITPEMLSPDLATLTQETATAPGTPAGRRPQAVKLADAVDQLEIDMIRAALDQADGNISETARQLGLTRRGLYLKLRRHGLGVSASMDTQ